MTARRSKRITPPKLAPTPMPILAPFVRPLFTLAVCVGLVAGAASEASEDEAALDEDVEVTDEVDLEADVLLEIEEELDDEDVASLLILK